MLTSKRKLLPTIIDDAVTRQQSLNASFQCYEDKHEDIRKLFSDVEITLLTSINLDAQHPLVHDWDNLASEYDDLSRESKLNANRCATSLEYYKHDLVPLIDSGNVQTPIVQRFKEDISAYQQSASNISGRFSKLKRHVKSFHARVKSHKKQQKDTLLNNVKSFFKSAWQAVLDLLDAIVQAFVALFSCIEKIRFACGPFEAEVHFSRSAMQELKRRSKPSIALPPMRSVCLDATGSEQQLVDDLHGFEEIWQQILLACDDALSHMERAMSHSASNAPPPVYRAETKSSATYKVYHPMVQNLKMYARGRSFAS